MRHKSRTAREIYLAGVAGGVLAFIGAAAPAAAAEQTQGNAGAATQLPEVVVTAERTTQNLQKVPIAATVVTGADLASQRIDRMTDLQTVAPSLSIKTYNMSTFVNIRGVGMAQSAPSSSPGVATYIDGTLIPHEFIINGSFYDINAIEVLRGPQGTLTGQNSTGGAIYVTTPAPNFTQWNATVDETVGDHALYRSVVTANMPLVQDRVALRLSGTDNRRSSYTDNIGSSAQPGNEGFDGIRADLGFRATDRLTGNIRGEYFRTSNDNTAIKNPKVLPGTPFTVDQDGVTRYTVEGYRTDLELKYAITDRIQARLLTDYQSSHVLNLDDGDRSATAPPQPPASNTGRLFQNNLNIRTQTNELDLIGDVGSLHWVAGAFLMHDEVDLLQDYYGNDTVTVTHAPTKITAYNTINDSVSGFGQGTYTWNQFQVVAGLRYSSDTQHFERISPAGPTALASSNVVTGKFAVNYFVKPDTMLYASVSRGYKAGGGNPVPGTPNYAPEYNLVEEVGLKSTLLQRKIRVDAALFNQDYRNLQLLSVTPTRIPETQNLSSSRGYGAEVDAQGRFGGLHLDFGAAYLENTSSVGATLLNNTGPAAVLGFVGSGSSLPFSPNWSVTGRAEYEFSLGGWGSLTPSVRWSYTSLQWASIFHNAASVIPAHDVTDVHVTWRPARGAWELEAFATNLFNRTYIASQVFNSSGNNGGTIYGDRREVGVRGVYHFD